MKPGNIREMEVSEIEIKLQDMKKEYFNLKCQKVFGMLESTANMGRIKKDIARCNTIITEKKNSKQVEN